MYIILDSNNNVIDVHDEHPGRETPHVIASWDINTFDEATRLAEQLTDLKGLRYLPLDRGDNCYPQFGVFKAPAIGDPVSYAFNGDYYPCGHIMKISRSLYKIQTDEGKTFFRRKQTQNWTMKGGTWSMVKGHHDDKNPSF